jgi:hypothetical protein
MHNIVQHRSDAEKFDTQQVTVSGIFGMSPGTHSYPQLLLKDRSAVVLVFNGAIKRPSPETLERYKGKTILAEGVIYVKHIPEKYGIIGRVSAPYLLDIGSFRIR